MTTPPRSHSGQRRGPLGARGDSLYRSGYALIANVAGTTILGVGFWAVAAHLYSRQQVGQASALVAALVVVSSFAQLNLNNTLPRFLPQAGRRAGRLIGYGYAASSGAALVIGLGFVAILPRLSTEWHFLGDSIILSTGFVVAAVAWGVFALQDSVLLGLQRSEVVPLENAVYGILKLLMLAGITATLPETGIFIAWIVPLAISVPAVNGLIYGRYLKRWKFATAETTVSRREIIRFTSVDYVGNLLSQTAGNLLPLLVLTALGAAADASFYIAWTITTGLNLVAMSFATSLLVEGSASPDRLSELTRGVLVRTLAVTVTGAAVLGLGARLVLDVYGHEYAVQAAQVLGLLAAGSVFYSLLAIVFSIDRITGRVSRATLTRLVLGVLMLGASWLLLPPMGIDGVGVAWLGANLVVAVARMPTLFATARRHTVKVAVPVAAVTPVAGRPGLSVVARSGGAARSGWGAAQYRGGSGVSIGEALAEARRQAGLTLTQVSDQTGIRETIITCIEGDDFSGCGGELYVRGYIRTIARAVGADPEALIWEYEAAQLGPQTITNDADEPVTPARAHKPGWIALSVLALGVMGLCVTVFHFLVGWPPTISAAPADRAASVTHHRSHGTQVTPAPAPKTATPAAVAARALTPASAAAFGPAGAGQGDNPAMAPLAIDADPATAWHTDWYTSAHFGSLYPGTGLLVDMGRPVTITAARITLGPAHGASLQLRVGATPALADLPPVAHVANAGGVVRLRLTTPARGRYVLIWFTSLPPDPAGTFQASVHNLRLDGRT